MSIWITFLLNLLVSAATNIILIGGNLQDNNSEVYDKIISFAGGIDNAKIGIISSGSADPQGTATNISNVFAVSYKLNSTYWIPITSDNYQTQNMNETIAAMVDTMTGFYFAGGDQYWIVNTLVLNNGSDSLVLAHIRNRFRNGAVAVGTSAGADALQGAPMITGGDSYFGLIYGTFEFAPELEDTNNVTYYHSGLGFWNYFIVDTHFGARGRQGRTLRLAADRLVNWIYGLDENTALVVTDADNIQTVKMTVLGQYGVYIFDLRNAKQTTYFDLQTNGTYWLYNGISCHYLTEDDTWFQYGSILQLANWKTAISSSHGDSLTSEDIFSSPWNPDPITGNPKNPNEFTKISLYLFDSSATSTYGTTYETDPIRYKVSMSKGPISKGYSGVEGGVRYISYYGMDVEIGLYFPDSSESDNKTRLIVGATIGSIFLVIMIAVPWCIARRRKKYSESLLERPSLKGIGGVNSYLI